MSDEKTELEFQSGNALMFIANVLLEILAELKALRDERG